MYLYTLSLTIFRRFPIFIIILLRRDTRIYTLVEDVLYCIINGATSFFPGPFPTTTYNKNPRITCSPLREKTFRTRLLLFFFFLQKVSRHKTHQKYYYTRILNIYTHMPHAHKIPL